jgi:hypothetical protein
MKQIPNIIIAAALAASASAQVQTTPTPGLPAPAREAAAGIPPQPIFTSSRQAVDEVRQQVSQLQSEQQLAETVLQSRPLSVDPRADQAEVELAYASRAVQLVQAENAPLAPATGRASSRQSAAPANPAPPAAIAGTTPRLAHVVNRGGAGALVIRSSDVDAKEQESLEQDLPVMARLLSKATSDNGAHSGYRAMGIDVTFAPGTGPIRSMYIEGYGALFMLNVGFPLLPPPNRSEPQKEKPAEDSAWEQAKHEVYGRPATTRVLRQAGEPFDESRVSQLKDSLLEALKNATNIRGLKSDDFITVCVFGGGSSRFVHTGSYNFTPEPPRAENSSDDTSENHAIWISGTPMSGGGHASLMTIRVKKSDVESFAKGKMNLDEFKHKARSSVSLTSAGGDSSPNSMTIFGNGGFGGFGGSWSGSDPFAAPTEP